MEAFIGFSWIFHKPSSLDWVPLMDTPPSKRILPPRRSILLASRAPWKIPLRDSWTAAPRSISWNLRLAKKNISVVQVTYILFECRILRLFSRRLFGWLNYVELKSNENVQDGLSGDEESVFSVFFFPRGFSGWWSLQTWEDHPWFPVGRMICRWCGHFGCLDCQRIMYPTCGFQGSPSHV